MTNQQANDLFSSLKTYINKVSEGEKSPQEIAASLNTWARESAESLRTKITEEVESQVHKLGFVKREEFDALAARISKLDGQKPSKSTKSKSVKVKKTSGVKKTTKKSPAKKSAPVKKVVKKSAQKKG
jgi:BMFP domain-containing protein YqiC